MEKLEKIVRLCKIVYPDHNYEGHLKPVVDIALQLCERFGADRNIVEPAAYLHDLGRVAFCYLNLVGVGHEVSGYYSSRIILRLFGYSKEDAEKISHCVLAHTGRSEKYESESLEDEIIANADAISHFEQYLYQLAIHYSCHGRRLADTKKWVLWKLKQSYDTKLTLPGVKEEIGPLYEKAKRDLASG